MDINSLYKSTAGGDKEAEEELFRSLTARFRLFARQKIWIEEDAEEIVQDALLTVFNKYRGIDFEISFAAWAHRVLNNKILNYYKAKSLHEIKLSQMQNEYDRSSTGGDAFDLEKQLLDCIRKVSRANKRHARILNLHYQGYVVEEICHRLNLTRNNLYSVLSRARSMLELCLEKGDIK